MVMHVTQLKFVTHQKIIVAIVLQLLYLVINQMVATIMVPVFIASVFVIQIMQVYSVKFNAHLVNMVAIVIKM